MDAANVPTPGSDAVLPDNMLHDIMLPDSLEGPVTIEMVCLLGNPGYLICDVKKTLAAPAP